MSCLTGYAKNLNRLQGRSPFGRLPPPVADCLCLFLHNEFCHNVNHNTDRKSRQHEFLRAALCNCHSFKTESPVIGATQAS